MGAPGWPELAFCTASIARVRMVLMLKISSCLLESRVCSLATIVGFSLQTSDHCINAANPYNLLQPEKIPHIRQFTKLSNDACRQKQETARGRELPHHSFRMNREG